MNHARQPLPMKTRTRVADIILGDRDTFPASPCFFRKLRLVPNQPFTVKAVDLKSEPDPFQPHVFCAEWRTASDGTDGRWVISTAANVALSSFTLFELFANPGQWIQSTPEEIADFTAQQTRMANWIATETAE